MATPFRSRVLQVVDRLYSFVGSAAVSSRFSTEAPVQPVHDVSREAELNGAYGQFFGEGVVLLTNTHAGATTEDNQFDLYDEVAGTGVLDPVQSPRFEDIAIYLLTRPVFYENIGLSGFTLVEAELAFNGDLPPGAGESIFPLFYSTGTQVNWPDYPMTGNTSLCQRAAADPFLTLSDENYPLHVPRPGRINIRSTAGAAGDIWGAFRVWVGRKGTTPAGLR